MCLGEGLENPRSLVRGHATTGITHLENDPIEGFDSLTLCGQGDCAVPREFAGLTQKVEQYLAHLGQVTVDRADIACARNLECVAILLGQRHDGRRYALNHGSELEDL